MKFKIGTAVAIGMILGSVPALAQTTPAGNGTSTPAGSAVGSGSQSEMKSGSMTKSSSGSMMKSDSMKAGAPATGTGTSAGTRDRWSSRRQSDEELRKRCPAILSGTGIRTATQGPSGPSCQCAIVFDAMRQPT